MKKHLLLIIPFLLAGCSNGQPSSSTPISSSSSEISSSSQGDLPIDNIYNESFGDIVSIDKIPQNKDAKQYFKDEYKDSSFDDSKIITGYKYENNQRVSFGGTDAKTKDYKSIFYDNRSVRFVNTSDGYALTFPSSTSVKTDFSLGEYRSKLYNKESTLTVSLEDKNPYGNHIKGWKTYRDEWVTIFLERASWYTANNVEFTRPKKYEDTTVIQGYSLIEYDVVINEAGNLTKNYYNICVLRKTEAYTKFHLLVMKSSSNQNDTFDKILKSFKEINSYGTSNNASYYKMPAEDNPKWNEKTLNYYHKLKEQEYTDWGLFTSNLPNDTGSQGHCEQSEIDAYRLKLIKDDTDFDYHFNVCSSYNHVSWMGDFSVFYFPLVAATEFCGDGVDDKPILQFSYQFTNNNNKVNEDTETSMFSPQFDILRGPTSVQEGNEYRNGIYTQLVKLAKAIKAYEKPLMFRLNNEMNSDWCTYCGLMNLLDPDLFAAAWRMVYNIFEEEGCDNVIWIFNPFTPSAPYSRWGKDLCYFPGYKYINVLGLTYYVMNNNNEAADKTFKKAFQEVYQNNYRYFNDFPWYISEFGCGAGNQGYQYQESQTAYIENMWEYLNADTRQAFCKNIKGAIWFCNNDMSAEGKIVNSLSFYNEDKTGWAVPNSAAAFIKGLKEQHR